MIIEFIVSSALQEWVARKFKRSPKNNIKEIQKLKRQTTNHVRTVGELKEILNSFADDVPLGNKYEWYHVQVLEINNRGSLHIGQVQTWGSDV